MPGSDAKSPSPPIQESPEPRIVRALINPKAVDSLTVTPPVRMGKDRPQAMDTTQPTTIFNESKTKLGQEDVDREPLKG
jgi:hypothetical protein